MAVQLLPYCPLSAVGKLFKGNLKSNKTRHMYNVGKKFMSEFMKKTIMAIGISEKVYCFFIFTKTERS